MSFEISAFPAFVGVAMDRLEYSNRDGASSRMTSPSRSSKCFRRKLHSKAKKARWVAKDGSPGEFAPIDFHQPSIDSSRGWDKNRSKLQASSASSSSLASPSSSYVKLGASDLYVSEIGCGTLAFGDPRHGYGTTVTEDDLRQTCRFLVNHGVNWFDSAEVYGYQNIQNNCSSEALVGKFIREANEERGKVRQLESQFGKPTQDEILFASKFFPVPWTNILIGGNVRFGKQAVLDALDASIRRSGLDHIDLYQLHFPFPYVGGFDALTTALAEAYEKGLIKAVGVSNYKEQDLRKIHRMLSRLGVPLASNQIKYSIVDRDAELEGLLEVCKELNVKPIAHSPLERGLLSNRALEMPDDQLNPTERDLRNKYKPLLNLMKFIGAVNGNRTISQVALNYVICKGLIPIPGMKHEGHARECVGAMDWRLDSSSLDALDEKSLFLSKL